MTAPDEPSSEYERILAENARYVEAFDRSALTAAPLSGILVLACMDARLDVEEALGLRTGDAHIVRNAGGHASDDASAGPRIPINVTARAAAACGRRADPGHSNAIIVARTAMTAS